MRLLNAEKKLMLRAGSFPVVWAAAVALFLVTGLSDTAMGAASSVETVTTSQQEFNFEVHPQGGFSGNNSITFQVSRVEEPRGITKRCRKINYVSAVHMEPGSVSLGNNPYYYRVGYGELDTPLCTFTGLEISGQPFREQDINSVCFDIPMRSVNNTSGGQFPSGAPPVFIPGKSAVLEKEIRFDFVQTLGSFIYGRRVPEKTVTLRANIQCVDNTVSGGTGPVWGGGDASQGTRGTQFTPVDPRTASRVPASGTGTTGGAAQCDLSGAWDGYNNGTRTTGWQFEQIFTAGGSVTYRATHLSAQRAPTGGEGTITRSPSGNYLFHTLQTKVPTANAAYQASTMRIYDADASCGKLTERQLYDTTSGMVNRGGSYWLQRVSTASNPPSRVQTPVSPVGKPTSPTTVFKPRSAPNLPGSTFKPGPDLPPKGEPSAP
ncbi:MAG: hypothetical protein RRA15_13470 [bacterium]|nr:hypothetical protein [bacterium]MDT8367468.1 hypothetical protein [bacterium]